MARSIRDIVVARAENLGLSAYAIAKASNGAVSEDAVKRYMMGRGDITTGKLDAVFRALSLVVVPRKSTPDKTV